MPLSVTGSRRSPQPVPSWLACCFSTQLLLPAATQLGTPASRMAATERMWIQKGIIRRRHRVQQPSLPNKVVVWENHGSPICRRCSGILVSVAVMCLGPSPSNSSEGREGRKASISHRPPKVYSKNGSCERGTSPKELPESSRNAPKLLRFEGIHSASFSWGPVNASRLSLGAHRAGERWESSEAAQSPHGSVELFRTRSVFAPTGAHLRFVKRDPCGL